MRIIDWKTLRTMTPYSRQHILRLETDGKFPKRVQLGPCRVGWVYDEIVEHNQKLIDQRDNPPDSPR